MTHLYLRQAFQPSCPSGGNWYACGSGSNFVGCCTSEPCANSCPDGNLEPASFNSSYYGQFPDQQCPTGSRWYSCAYTDPPFLGCCKSSPCAGGCPVGDLTAGFLSSNPAVAGAFSPSPAIPSATTATSSSLSARSSSSSTGPPASMSSSKASITSTTHHSTPIGIIIGATVGGIAILVVALLVWYHKRHTLLSRSQSQQRMSAHSTDKKVQGAATDTRDMDSASVSSMSLCQYLLLHVPTIKARLIHYPTELPFEKPFAAAMAHEAPDTPSLSGFAVSPGKNSNWMGTPRSMPSPQPSYELPSSFVSPMPLHSHSSSTIYPDDLGIMSGVSGSPSFSSLRGKTPLPIDLNSRCELSSAESTTHRAELPDASFDDIVYNRSPSPEASTSLLRSGFTIVHGPSPR